MTTGGAAAVRGAHRHPLAALVVANLVYAGAFPASEVALRELGPMTLAGFRFLVAALLLAPVAVPALRRITLAQTLRLLSIAALGLWLQMVLIYYGIDQANGAIAAIIVGLEPVLIAAWAALLLHERFGGRRVAGLAVGLAGSLLVAGVGLEGGAGTGGVILLLGTGLSFSWYTVASKRHLPRHGALELTALISVLGAVVAVVPMIVDVTLLDGWRDPGAADLGDRHLPGRRQQRDRLRPLESGAGRAARSRRRRVAVRPAGARRRALLGAAARSAAAHVPTGRCAGAARRLDREPPGGGSENDPVAVAARVARGVQRAVRADRHGVGAAEVQVQPAERDRPLAPSLERVHHRRVDPALAVEPVALDVHAGK